MIDHPACNGRECEQSALFMRNKELNFNSPEEEESVALIFKQAMECLKEEDRELQFIDSLLPLLKRGIGVHHSGLLPILKEVIELLFQEQLIKVSLTRKEKKGKGRKGKERKGKERKEKSLQSGVTVQA